MILKFRPSLAALILAGTKTTTWRLFDEKDLKVGDVIDLINKETGEVFAQAVITKAYEKPLKDLDDADREGHEEFPSDAAMNEAFRAYYPGRDIGPATPVKVVRFVLNGAK
jgi:hypothetical protein